MNKEETTSSAEVESSKANETKHRFWKNADGEMVYLVQCVMKEDVIYALKDYGNMKVSKALRDSIDNLSDEEMCSLANELTNKLNMDDYWESLYSASEHFLGDEIKKNEKEVKNEIM